MSEPSDTTATRHNDYLALAELTLAYGKSVVVDKLNLSVSRGELIAFLGPSGCGKSTTLRAIAGLMKPLSGTITLDGQALTHTPANRRNVGMVFQSYALFPHLSVSENVAFGLRLKHLPSAALSAAVAEGLSTVGLTDFADRKPSELSGGQQQRVALARALVMKPKLLLLDEPLSNLDARLRLEMRAELQRVQRETGLTMIFVTHDQTEALSLADRIVVMNEGLIEQLGTPEFIYNQPASRFVANFVGFENIFEVQNRKMLTRGGEILLSDALPATAAGLAWRPTSITLGSGPFEARVIASSFMGNARSYLLESPVGRINAEVEAEQREYQADERVQFDLPLYSAAILDRY